MNDHYSSCREPEPNTDMTKWQEVALALQYVKRYHMCDLSRKQNVAEHSFNVTMIVLETALWLDADSTVLSYKNLYRIVIRALLHDLPEHFTGDLDYWVKNDRGMNEACKKMEHEAVNTFTNFLPLWMRGDIVMALSDCNKENLDYCIVKQADYLELANFCLNDAERGNRKSLAIAKNGFVVIHKYDHSVLDSFLCPLRILEVSLKEKYKQLGGKI